MFRITEDAKNTFSVILELNDVVETDAGLYKVILCVWECVGSRNMVILPL